MHNKKWSSSQKGMSKSIPKSISSFVSKVNLTGAMLEQGWNKAGARLEQGWSKAGQGRTKADQNWPKLAKAGQNWPGLAKIGQG